MMGLEAWIDAETRIATDAMLGVISASHLVMERPGFGQRVIPRPGSVLASPVPAHYDPEPDYFFHWFRDSSIVIDALRVALAAGYVGSSAVGRFREFLQFSRALLSLDGREFLRRVQFRTDVQPAFLQYLRPDAEIAALSGEAVLADVRVNADGTPDFTRWSRPQADGPALRSIALRRWWQQLPDLDATLASALQELISADLAFTLSWARRTCFDIWEEVSGYHYYTQLLQAEALARGAQWLEQTGQHARARVCRVAADGLAAQLDAFWNDAAGCYRSHSAATAGGSGGELDIAVILAVLHAGRASGSHSVLDPRAQATLTALEELFEAEYAINRERPPGQAAAMGRYSERPLLQWRSLFLRDAGSGRVLLQVGRSAARGGENRRYPGEPALSAAPGSRATAVRKCRGGNARHAARRCVPADGAAVHARRWRAFRAI